MILLQNKAETPSDISENILTNDTTKQHKNHLFDLNCKICTGKMAPPADDEVPPAKRVRIGKTVVCGGANKLSRLEEITIGEIRLHSQDDDMNDDILYHDDDDDSVATSSDSVATAKINNEDVNSHDKTQLVAVSQGQRSELSDVKVESKSGLKSCLKGKPAGATSKSSLSESSAVAVSTTTVR